MSTDTAERLKKMASLSPEKRKLLALKLQARAKAEAASREIPVREIQGPMPLSDSQLGLWLLHQMDPGNSAYNNQEALHLHGCLDCMGLFSSLQHIVDRHEILRTRYVNHGSEPQQLVEQVVLTPTFVDLSGMHSELASSSAEFLAQRDFETAFDLEHGPILRVNLIRIHATHHLLAMSMHHITGDGASGPLIMAELKQLYAAHLRGEEHSLEPLKRQYGDFACWQHGASQQALREKQRAYWQKQLADAPTLLELPTDRPRPRSQTFAGDTYTFEVPAHLLDKLRHLGKETTTTLFHVLLAGFQTLLHRYSGQDDICVGIPVTHRQRSELAPLVGLFLNQLVIRTKLLGRESLASLAKRTRDTVVAAQSHGDLAFEDVVRSLGIPRDPAYNPLYQVMFIFHELMGDPIGLSGLEVHHQPAKNTSAKLDLTLTMRLQKEGLFGDIEYNRDLFDRETVANMAAHLLSILGGSANAQVAHSLVMSPPTDISSATVYQLVGYTADAYPTQTAVSFGSKTWTYAQLWETSHKLAHHLQQRGIKPGDRVGVCLDRCQEMPAVLLAIFACGAAYVPIDPDHPETRNKLVLASADPKLVVCHAQTRDRLDLDDFMCLDEEADAIAGQSCGALDVAQVEGAPAYLIFTSGSTGRPKGVVVPHRAVCNFLVHMAESPGLGMDDTLVAVTTLSFDISVLEIFLPLVTGAHLVIADRAATQDGQKLAALLRSSEATVMQATPATWRMLLGTAFDGNIRVFCGGEALDQELAQSLGNMGLNVENLYGPTETTIWSSHASIEPGQGVTLGKPIANTTLAVVNSFCELVPLGARGELLIGGAGVTQGYWQQPGLTAARFLPDPHSSQPGGRRYLTGDAVSFNNAGLMRYHGRLDFQVKLRGFRIELGEIEAIISAHPAVQSAVVVLHRGKQEPLLVAWLQLVEEYTEQIIEDIRGWARQGLPSYMVPSVFAPLSELPLTPNGKVNRKVLATRSIENFLTQAAYIAPTTDAEKTTAAIWADVLGHERVGLHDSFFDLGGHSLLANTVVVRMRDAFGVDLPMRALFENPTIAQLVKVLEVAQVSSEEPIVPVDRSTRLPLSPAQQRLWYLDCLEGANASYNMTAILRLGGQLDTVALSNALSQVVCRHEILRTRFPSIEGEPYQQILDTRTWVLHTTQVKGGFNEALAFAVAEGQRPFDLKAGDLKRAHLFQLGETDHLLLLAMSHLIADGWSTGILIREVAECYRAACDGAPLSLSELPLQYGDYSVWQHASLESESMGETKQWWLQQLQDAPSLLEMPYDRPRPKQPSHQAGHHTWVTPPMLVNALKRQAHERGATLFMQLQLAFSLLLSRYSGQQDIVIGTPVANRTRGEFEDMIGLFSNTLALRTQLHDEQLAYGDHLALVREQTLSAFSRQNMPFEKLVEALNPERQTGVNPIFQVMLVLQNVVEVPPQLPGLTSQFVPVEAYSAKFDITLTFDESEQGLVANLEYAAELFDEATMARMACHFQYLLSQIAEQPDTSIADLALMAEAERAELLHLCQGEEKQWGPHTTIDGWFQATAEHSAQALAVRAPDGDLSYAQLDEASNRMAHYLRTQGVGPETPVGLCLQRSKQLIIAIYAVLKAGGYYVPLDSDYPEGRLRMMAEDARLSLILCGDGNPQWADEMSLRTVSLARLDLDEYSTALPQPRHHGSSAMYQIFTSGSTGRPKGVVNCHTALVNRLSWMQEYFGLTPSDRVLHKTPFSFDVSVWELCWPLLVGAPMIVAEPGRHGDPQYLADLIDREAVSVLHFVPAMLEAFLNGQSLGSLPSLKHVICSGEALSEDLRLQAEAALDANIHNLYGPTEAAIDVTAWTCQRSQAYSHSVPIGRPISNTEIYITDPSCQMQPLGVAGQLCIAGTGLARGYGQRPALTAERFVPNPFSVIPGMRMYLSGDLARYNNQESISYLGRLDFQVKLRGFRIEVGEIETAIRAHERVREVVVVFRSKGIGGSAMLDAFVVADGNLASDDLVQALKTKLPDYMVPSRFNFLPALPLSANGKVDRKQLINTPLSEAQHQGEKRQPGNELQRLMAEAWAEIFDLPNVGIDDNFFDLGGHSLIATRLVYKISQRCGISLGLGDLFQWPTIAQLSEQLSQRLGEEGHKTVSDDLPTLHHEPQHENEPFELTDIQQAYWIGRQNDLELGNVGTHSYVEFDSPDFNVARIEDILNEIIEVHGMMRAIMLPTGEQQILAEVPRYRIATTDLRHMTKGPLEKRLQDMRNELSHRMLASDRWPLFEVRATLLPDRVRLHIDFDALIIDAWSSRILADAFFKRYAGGEPLQPLSLSFRDYVNSEQEMEKTEFYAQSRKYWLDRLEDLPPAPRLPLACSPESLDKPRFQRREGSLTPSQWKALQDRAAKAGTTPSGVLIAAFAEVLAHWGDTPRFTLNLTLFKRLPLHEDVDKLLGDFTSLNLLEVDFTPGPSFSRRAANLQQQLWRDLDHNYFSGIRVLRKLMAASGGEQGALMPVVFTSTLGMNHADEKPPISLDIPFAITQTPQVWLDNQVVEDNGHLRFLWDAVEDLFPTGMLDLMFEAYQKLLHELATSQESWEASSPVITPVAHLDLYRDANNTAGELPQQLLHDGFLRQVRQQPHATALIHEETTMSYSEVARRSAVVARYLKTRGVCPNELVGVVLDKGWEQSIAVLGILRSGAAYMPIDPKLPTARRNLLLEQGRARHALTHQDLLDSDDWTADVTLLAIDALEPGVDEALELPVHQGLNDLAYVIFTSGSTGTPKGVAIEHLGAQNTVADINHRFSVNAQDKVLAVSSLSFDLSVWDIFGAYSAGATLVVPPSSEVPSPEKWLELLQQHAVTIWNSAPPLLQMLFDAAPGSLSPLEDMRLVMLSGDWIPLSLPEKIDQFFPKAEKISMGGATEASIWSIIYPFDTVEPSWKSIPYGKAMRNQQFHVLDEHLAPRPVWVQGHLYIGGVGLAREYWADETKTNASFIVHPNSGERLYRTGDMGRYLPDGNIEFLGRQDAQVKVRGFRVELGEIETILVRHPMIKDAIVLLHGKEKNNKHLVAYVVPEATHGNGDEQPSALADHEVILRDPVERTLFKLQEPGLRTPQEHWVYHEMTGTVPTQLHFLGHAMVSEPAHGLVSVEELMTLLSCLGQQDVPGYPQPKYFYPSAGSLYPVQTYVYLPAGHSQWGAGFYYYHAGQHVLWHLGDDSSPAYTEPRIFLVGDLAAIQPIYGSALSTAFCSLEAGYMAWLLGSQASLRGFQLNQTEAGPLADLRKALVLGDQHRLMCQLTFSGSNTGAELNASQNAKAETSLTHGGVAPFDVGTLSRQSYRSFSKETLPAQSLTQLLAGIYQLAGMPNGITHPQLHLYVKAGSFEGMDEGAYTFENDSLLPVGRFSSIERGLYSDVNRHIFDEAGFALFLTCSHELDLSDRHHFLMGAGCIGQALMTLAPQLGMGLCPIGYMDPEPLKMALGLSDKGQIIHSLLGGSITQQQTQTWWSVQPNAHQNAPDKQLKTYLAQQLPHYMVPEVFVPLQALPLTPNGKIDKKSLPSPDLGEHSSKTHVGPRNDLEVQVHALWTEILETENIGVTDNFFELGGQSLLAVRLMTRVREQFQITFSLAQFFKAPTIGETANYIKAMQWASNSPVVANPDDSREEGLL